KRAYLFPAQGSTRIAPMEMKGCNKRRRRTMSDTPLHSDPEGALSGARINAPAPLNEIYAKLTQQDVEQFYIGYQLWHMQQRITSLQQTIDGLRQQLDENTQ